MPHRTLPCTRSAQVLLVLLVPLLANARAATAQTAEQGASSTRRPQESNDRRRGSAERAPFSGGDLGGVLAANGLDVELIGGVPAGDLTAGSLPLSLREAVERGLRQNLGVKLRADAVAEARGRQLEERADLLPSLSLGTFQRSQELNFEATAFHDFSGADPVVQYDSFDARLLLRAPLLDLAARADARAAAERLQAAELRQEQIRAAAVLFVGNLYLDAVARQTRVEAAAAQVATAQALRDLAVARQRTGLANRLDVLRSEVELRAEEHRSLVERNAMERTKLQLARAIGLPIGQEFHLTETLDLDPAPPPALEELLALAESRRPDLAAAQARLRAAEADRRGAGAERLPSLYLDADYGSSGPSIDDTHGTFSAAARLQVPLFSGGRHRGERIAASAEVARQQALLADLHANVYYEIRGALLDLEAGEQEVTVARQGLALAEEALDQARDRFSAGVADNLEVVAAQGQMATARERLIDGQLSHRHARGSLARAIGMDADEIVDAIFRRVRALEPASGAGAAGGAER